MTDSKDHARRVCRVDVNVKDLAEHGLPLPPGTEIVRIVPNLDKLEFLEDHWIWLRNEELPEVPPGCNVPVRHIVVEYIERSLGPHTVMKQKKASFSHES